MYKLLKEQNSEMICMSNESAEFLKVEYVQKKGEVN